MHMYIHIFDTHTQPNLRPAFQAPHGPMFSRQVAKVDGLMDPVRLRRGIGIPLPAQFGTEVHRDVAEALLVPRGNL